MSDRITNSFSVTYRYPVLFTHGAFGLTNPVLAEVLAEVCGTGPRPCLVLIDGGLAAADPQMESRVGAYLEAHREVASLCGRPRVVPGGEVAKSGWEVPNLTLRLAAAAGLCRQSVVIAVGGGAMLDAVGLGVALFHRGARLVRCPTTVLAQCDSGVGVKNGINLDGCKNLAGVFAPPAAVVNDIDTLRTLSDRDWRAGVAEAFKVAAIRDVGFLAWLEAHAGELRGRDTAAMEYLVRHCAALHCQHIVGGGDPFESGSARPLDFGHWSAHKIEALSSFTLRHGEAVAVGIAVDLLYAVRLGLVGRDEAERLIRAMARCGLATWHAALENRAADGTPAVLAGLEEFRVHLGGDLQLTVPAPLGQSRELTALDPALLGEVIGELRALCRGLCQGGAP
jgi:3-dehydroquinate synthase